MEKSGRGSANKRWLLSRRPGLHLGGSWLPRRRAHRRADSHSSRPLTVGIIASLFALMAGQVTHLPDMFVMKRSFGLIIPHSEKSDPSAGA